jgi:hypothetical protein
MKGYKKLRKLIKKGGRKEKKRIKKALKGEISFPEDEGLQDLWIEIVRHRIMKKDKS